RMRVRQHRRMNAHSDLTVDLLGDRNELDRVAETLRVLDVAMGDVRDALAVDLSGDDSRAERDGREDGRLRRRVEAFDVRGRVLFGVAERLGLRESLRERHAALGHTGEDEVRRPVDDPDDLLDPLTRERLLQGPDQWDPAAHRGLE